MKIKKFILPLVMLLIGGIIGYFICRCCPSHHKQCKNKEHKKCCDPKGNSDSIDYSFDWNGAFSWASCNATGKVPEHDPLHPDWARIINTGNYRLLNDQYKSTYTATSPEDTLTLGVVFHKCLLYSIINSLSSDSMYVRLSFGYDKSKSALIPIIVGGKVRPGGSVSNENLMYQTTGNREAYCPINCE